MTNRCYPPTAPGQVTTSILRTLVLADPRNWSVLCVITGFRRGVYEILALLGRYGAQIGSYRRFGSSNARTTWLLKTEQIVCPETSRINYQPKLRNVPEERRSYLFLSRVELRFSLQLVKLCTILTQLRLILSAISSPFFFMWDWWEIIEKRLAYWFHNVLWGVSSPLCVE